MEGSGVVGGVKKELLRRSSTEPIKVVTVLDTAVSTDCLTMASRAANGLDVDTLGVVTVDTELTTVVAALEAVVAVEAALLPTGVDDETKELGLETDGLVLVLDVTAGGDPEPTAGGACVAITSDSRSLSKSAEKEFSFATFLAIATSKLL